jgi:hypothetical protein
MFISIAMILGLFQFIFGIKSMFKYGINIETTPTLWIIIPILTLIGIALIRILFGLDHHFENTLSLKAGLFALTSIILSIQIIFGILGYFVMKKIGYFNKYLNGSENSVISYALVCPGVAIFVFGMFFIKFGLLANGIVSIFSIPYFILLLPLIYIQYKTVQTLFKLNKKFFK